jgi:hypothetical protein
MKEFPVLRIELQSMIHSIQAAFSENIMQLDFDVKTAIDEFCRPENLRQIVQNQVSTVLKNVIQQEIHNYYTYGDGREVIKAAIKNRLDNNETSLDY